MAILPLRQLLQRISACRDGLHMPLTQRVLRPVFLVTRRQRTRAKWGIYHHFLQSVLSNSLTPNVHTHFRQVMERRIISRVVMGVGGSLNPPLLLVVVFLVFLEDGLFDRYLPCRIRDKSTIQRCDNSLLHQYRCLLTGINGTVVEMVDVIEILFYLVASRKQAILIYTHSVVSSSVLWTQRF